MCKKHDESDQRASPGRQKWRLSKLTYIEHFFLDERQGPRVSFEKYEKGKKERKKNIREKNTRERETSVCKREGEEEKKETERRSNVDPVQSRKPVEYGIKPRLGVSECSSMIKTGYNGGTIDGTLLCASRKKNFLEDSPCVKDFPLFASKQEGCWNITFDRFESDRPRITRPNGAWKRIETYMDPFSRGRVPNRFDQAPINGSV